MAYLTRYSNLTVLDTAIASTINGNVGTDTLSVTSDIALNGNDITGANLIDANTVSIVTLQTDRVSGFYDLDLITPNNTANGDGTGTIQIRSGNANSVGAAGGIELFAGYNLNGVGGAVGIFAGDSRGNNNGGLLSLYSGDGGDGATTGNGGNIELYAGDARGTSGNGGSILMYSGEGNGGGQGGNIELYANTVRISNNLVVSNIVGNTANVQITNAQFTNPITTIGALETFQTISGATGNANIVYTAGAIVNMTSVAGNFTPNISNLTLSNSLATNMVLIVNQGATAYSPQANIGINGSNVAVKWQGGSLPTGTANKSDIVSYSIANVAGTYLVLGQLVSFG